MGKKQNESIPNLKALRPSRKDEASVVVQQRLGVEGTRRLGVDVPAAIYAQVEERCRERGVTKRDFILELLRRDGIG